ncbi:DUF6232 family protein [Nonomuraea sp. NPDC050663]|uniref:DUF6232 family protein n=1 Tax=Nonomuraea sp. NPDC050663 TaxID=3364370 RepID=UPI00379DCE0E
MGHSVVQVRIADRSLWIGNDVYPLGAIAHVGMRTLEINKGRAWTRFIIRALVTVVVGSIAMAIFDTFGLILMLGALGFWIWRLVAAISLPPVHGLVIQNAGARVDAVWSANEKEISNLIYEITGAIGTPTAVNKVFNINAVQGDLIQTYGGGIGKAHHSGTGNVIGR